MNRRMKYLKTSWTLAIVLSASFLTAPLSAAKLGGPAKMAVSTRIQAPVIRSSGLLNFKKSETLRAVRQIGTLFQEVRKSASDNFQVLGQEIGKIYEGPQLAFAGAASSFDAAAGGSYGVKSYEDSISRMGSHKEEDSFNRSGSPAYYPGIGYVPKPEYPSEHEMAYRRDVKDSAYKLEDMFKSSMRFEATPMVKRQDLIDQIAARQEALKKTGEIASGDRSDEFLWNVRASIAVMPENVSTSDVAAFQKQIQRQIARATTFEELQNSGLTWTAWAQKQWDRMWRAI